METSPEKLGAHAGVVSFGAGATTKPGKRGLTKEYGSPGQSFLSPAWRRGVTGSITSAPNNPQKMVIRYVLARNFLSWPS